MAFAQPTKRRGKRRGKQQKNRRNANSKDLHKQYELLCRKSRCKPVKMVFDMLKIQTLMLQDAHTCALVQLKILYQLLSSGEAVLFNVHLAMGNKQLISARQRQKFRTDQRAELLGLILGTLGKPIRSSLKTLALHGLRFSLPNLRTLSNAVSFTKTLLALDLQQCHPLGPKFMKVLVKGLGSNSSIQFLSLARCGLDDNSGGQVVQLIETQTTVIAQRKWRKNLRVHFDDEAEKRHYAASDNGLLAIDLSGNSFSDFTIVPLANALLDGNVIALNLRGNRASESGLNALYHAVKRNKHLVRVLTLEAGGASPHDIDHIGRVCGKRTLPVKCREVLSPILQHWETSYPPPPPETGHDWQADALATPSTVASASPQKTKPRTRMKRPSAKSAALLEQCMKEVRGAFVRATSVDAHKEGVHRDDDALGQVKLNELMGLEQKLSTALQLVGGLTTTRLSTNDTAHADMADEYVDAIRERVNEMYS